MELLKWLTNESANLTLPQAIVIATGFLSLSIICSSAIDSGLTPDIDLKNKHFRFVRLDKNEPQIINE